MESVMNRTIVSVSSPGETQYWTQHVYYHFALASDKTPLMSVLGKENV